MFPRSKNGRRSFAFPSSASRGESPLRSHGLPILRCTSSTTAVSSSPCHKIESCDDKVSSLYISSCYNLESVCSQVTASMSRDTTNVTVGQESGRSFLSTSTHELRPNESDDVEGGILYTVASTK